MNIFRVIESHNLDQLTKLLISDIDVNCLRSSSPAWTPLHESIEQLENGGSVDALVLLLRYGASVDAWDDNHDSTPLLMALFRGQLEAVRLLLAVGANPNVVGSEGDTLLHWCVERGDHGTAALLLRCGATQTINSFGGLTGMTALGQAAHRLDLRMIQLLLQAGADPEALDADRLTALRRLPPRNEIENDTVWLAAEVLLTKGFNNRTLNNCH